MGILPKEFMEAIDILDRDGLPKGIDGFDMRHILNRNHPCGTVACLAGNVDFINERRGIFNMCTKAYSSEQAIKRAGLDYDIKLYLFSIIWTKTDNTLSGAIARARYVDKHGLPEDWEAQIHGKAPLSYKVKDVRAMTEEVINTTMRENKKNTLTMQVEQLLADLQSPRPNTTMDENLCESVVRKLNFRTCG